MPNEQNLIVPSSSEARKNGSKGGKKIRRSPQA